MIYLLLLFEGELDGSLLDEGDSDSDGVLLCDGFDEFDFDGVLESDGSGELDGVLLCEGLEEWDSDSSGEGEGDLHPGI